MNTHEYNEAMSAIASILDAFLSNVSMWHISGQLMKHSSASDLIKMFEETSADNVFDIHFHSIKKPIDEHRMGPWSDFYKQLRTDLRTMNFSSNEARLLELVGSVFIWCDSKEHYARRQNISVIDAEDHRNAYGIPADAH